MKWQANPNPDLATFAKSSGVGFGLDLYIGFGLDLGFFKQPDLDFKI